MQNTLENKSKFFAQYWGQEVLSDNLIFDKLTVDVHKMGLSTLKGSSLCLKPMSSITDEDAIECVKLYKNNLRGNIDTVEIHELIRASEELKERILLNYWNGIYNGFNVLAVFDYLRSKSYALPWMGLSVEQLVSFGWVKLKED